MKRTLCLVIFLTIYAPFVTQAEEIMLEDFEDGDVGQPYPDWEKVLAKYEVPKHTIQVGGANGTAKAYQLIDDSAQGQWFGKHFDNVSGEIYADFYCKNVEKTTSLWMAMRQDETNGYYIEFDEQEDQPINFGSSVGKTAVVDEYTADVWYHVQVQYDTTKGKATVWIDGRKVVDNGDCDKLDFVNSIGFGTGGSFVGTLWIDEVYVGTTPKPVGVDNTHTALPATWAAIKGE